MSLTCDHCCSARNQSESGSVTYAYLEVEVAISSHEYLVEFGFQCHVLCDEYKILLSCIHLSETDT